ncbi:MAG: hypothetical protein JSW45_03510 [Thiotrichales bacterium]|nr:MAG: hypothetical protein JSW45_03510 [Thiotrichales bacterium]
MLAHGRNMAELNTFTRILGLDPDEKPYIVRYGYARDTGNIINITTRPIMSAMFYLGQSIDLPDEARKSGIVHSGLADDEQGEPFDWSIVHDELFSVKTARDQPENAYVAVNYGDYWYYIDETDVDSKETLPMLSVVLTLKAGDEGSTSPVLTLPVGSR